MRFNSIQFLYPFKIIKKKKAKAIVIPYILVSYQVQVQELWEVAQANHFQRKASATLLDQTLKAPTT